MRFGVAGMRSGMHTFTCTGTAGSSPAIHARLQASRYGFALVPADDGTLLGRLRRSALEKTRPAPPNRSWNRDR